MIAFNNERNETTWQSSFVAMLPEIEQKLRLAFCRLDPEAREAWMVGCIPATRMKCSPSFKGSTTNWNV